MLSIFEGKQCFLKVCHDIFPLFYALNPSLIYHHCLAVLPSPPPACFSFFCPVYIPCVAPFTGPPEKKYEVHFNEQIVH